MCIQLVKLPVHGQLIDRYIHINLHKGNILKFINNLKLKSKLFLIAVLPLMGLLFFSGLQISINATIYEEIEDLNELTQLIAESSKLVHELQKERGMTAGFLSSKGTKFAEKLTAQRKDVDESLKSLNEIEMIINKIGNV